MSYELSPEHFYSIRRLLQRLCGIALRPGKENLVRARLTKRLTALSLESFDAYFDYLNRDTSGQELVAMVDVLTTNTTSFFRESSHFAYLRQQVMPRLRAPRRLLRFWSAGCASGEEPYTLAIVLNEVCSDIAGRDMRILATDISPRMLAVARRAVYDHEALRDLPTQMVQRYFTPLSHTPIPAYQVKESVRGLVRFARLNLMEQWPMHGVFDVIFCRNVMMYFDKPTQQWLAQRFWAQLAPGGYLFIGHSESLTAPGQAFRYVQPAIYMKTVDV